MAFEPLGLNKFAGKEQAVVGVDINGDEPNYEVLPAAKKALEK